MKIDEAIKHAGEVAEEKEKLAKTYEGFKDYGNPRSSITSGHKKCLECAEEHRQLAEWLKELQVYRNNLINQSLSDTLVHSENENERLHNRVNELSKELKAHREAWEKVRKGLRDKHRDSYFIGVYDAMKIVDKYRPKEGDVDADSN